MKLPPAATAALLAPLLLLASTGAPAALWGEALLGAGTADVWGHLWGYWWTAESLADGRLPLRGAPLAHPAGQDWWIIDLPVALVLAPVTALLGPPVAWLLACLAPVAAGAGGAALWLQRRGVHGAVAAAAGVGVALGPFPRGALLSGVPEALVVLWMPLFALLLEGALAPGSKPGRVALAGLAAAAVVLSGAYGAVIGGLVGAAVVLAALASADRRPAVLARALAVALPALAAVALLRWGLDTTAHPARTVDRPLARHSLPWWPLQALDGADLASFFVPYPLLGDHPLPATRHVHAVYLGPALALAAVVAARRRAARPLLALAGVALVVAVGPVLRVAGEGVVLLPPGQLLAHLGAHNLYRVGGLVGLAAVGAVALGLPRRLALPALALVLVDQLAFAPLPPRMPTVADPAGPVEVALAESSVEGAVVDLPFEREGTSARGPHPQRSLRLQAAHGRPIASGLYVPAMVGQTPAALKRMDHAIATTRRMARGEARGRVPPAFPRPLPAKACQRLQGELEAPGFAFLTLDREAIPEALHADAEAWVRACFGAPWVDGGGRAAWRVAPTP